MVRYLFDQPNIKCRSAFDFCVVFFVSCLYSSANVLANEKPVAMLLARFTHNFKWDKVHVACGKNCREESDKVFAIGYQVVKELVGF